MSLKSTPLPRCKATIRNTHTLKLFKTVKTNLKRAH